MKRLKITNDHGWTPRTLRKEEKKIKNISGVYIIDFSENSAAKAAGLEEGDVITKVNDVPVNTSAQLQEQVARYRPGDKIKVTYMRGNDEKTLTTVLRNRLGDTKVVKREEAKAITLYSSDECKNPR